MKRIGKKRNEAKKDDLQGKTWVKKFADKNAFNSMIFSVQSFLSEFEAGMSNYYLRSYGHKRCAVV